MAQSLVLRAGPLSMICDPAHAHLRRVRLGDHEVLRGIYGAVRDHGWATIPPSVSNWKSDIREDSFRLTFDVNCRFGVVDYFWRGTIIGESSGRITYDFDGESRSKFLRNRIGLCVLHPIRECAGNPCVVEYSDGVTQASVFPREVQPDQPFYDVRVISHDVADGIRAEVRFAGDTFEMEDQRNYTDASFKIYSTPQALPKPMPVEPGSKIHQTAAVCLQGQVGPVPTVASGRTPRLSIAPTPVLPLPPLGLCVAGHGRPLGAREMERLKSLRLSHLRVDLPLSSPGFSSVLRQAGAEAQAINAALHVAFTLSDNGDEELHALASELDRLKPKVSLWLVFHEDEPCTSAKWVRAARTMLQKYGANIPVAAGTKGFFYNLNNHRPAPEIGALPCFAVSPQVHQPDNLTMVENLAGQEYPVQTVRQFSSLPVVISPIHLRSPSDSTALMADPGSSEPVPSNLDPRQMSLFGASWMLGSIAHLAATGHVHSMTYFETTGWIGVMESDTGPSFPEEFPSQRGMVYPVFHLLADIGGFQAKNICPSVSTHPLQTEGLTLLDDHGQRRVLVANLTGESLSVIVKLDVGRAQVRYLDERNAESAMLQPEDFRALASRPIESVGGEIRLELFPYALARLDLE